jgi:ABC-type Fe3+/spermidine/putrescine transport system ATPase subunit
MNALEITSLSKAFGAQTALDDICLSVPSGSRTVIVGPSGSGKTTLLRMIAGFEFPDAGSLSLNGEVLVDSSHAVPAYQRQIGYVPQDGALFPHMTVAANIGFGLTQNGTARNQRILELMDSVVRRPAATCLAGAGSGATTSSDAARRAVFSARHRFARGHAQNGCAAAGERRGDHHSGHP